MAKLAGKHGYAVVVNFNTGEAEAKKVVDEIVAGSGRALAIQADVSREEQIVQCSRRRSGSWARLRRW